MVSYYMTTIVCSGWTDKPIATRNFLGSPHFPTIVRFKRGAEARVVVRHEFDLLENNAMGYCFLDAGQSELLRRSSESFNIFH